VSDETPSSPPAGLKVTAIENIPVLPLRDVVVYPHMVIPLFVGREKSIQALEAAMKADKRIMLVAQKQADVDDPKADDLYAIGTVASILQLLKLPDGTVKVLVEGVSRARIDSLEPASFFGAHVAMLADIDQYEEKELEVLSRSVISQFEQYVKLNKKVPPEVLTALSGIEDAGRLADTVAAHMSLKLGEKQKVLEILDVRQRLEHVLVAIEGEMDVLQIEKRIRGRVKAQMEKSQREYYLNEQMKAIQKELGEMEDGVNEVQELEQKIEKAGMPKEARDKATAELNKLKMMSPMSAEATVVRNYIDWLVKVPWKKRTKIIKDIARAEKILDEDHYGLEKVKERIVEYLAVQQRVDKIKGPILCLVGPPGVGKTSLGQSIARATNRKFVRMSLGGVRDEAEIRGHRRTYIGSLPGKIVQNMAKTGCRTRCSCSTKIDKMSMDFRGDPSSALLEVLDPEQNAHVQRPLPRGRSRPVAGDVRLHGQQPEHPGAAAGPHGSDPSAGLHRRRKAQYRPALPAAEADEEQRPEVRRAQGLRGRPARHRPLLHARSRRAQPRARDRQDLPQGGQAAAAGEERRQGVSHAEEPRQVPRRAALPLRQGRGRESHRPGHGPRLDGSRRRAADDRAAVVPGKGKLQRTGQLGDVMQESMEAAMTVVRSRSSLLGLEPGFLPEARCPLHVPEGATPKDGPSAGIGMCTALVSALTKAFRCAPTSR
jgi:ATP-dependent Lon protease